MNIHRLVTAEDDKGPTEARAGIGRGKRVKDSLSRGIERDGAADRRDNSEPRPFKASG
jgi:hypothetical protein